MATISAGASAELAAKSLRVVLSWTETGVSYDIDLCVLLLGADGKVRGDGDFVFYNQPEDSSGAARHDGRSGTSELATIELDTVPADVDRIALAASIAEGDFSAVAGLALAVTDASAVADEVRVEQMAAGHETAVVAAELYRHDGGWGLRAVRQGWDSGLAAMVVSFGVNVGGADAEPETPPPAPTPEVATPTPTPTHHLDEDSAPSSALGSGRRITPARPPVGAWGLGPDSLTLPLGQPVVLAGTDGTPMRQLWLRVSCPQADAGATADLSAVTFDHHGAPGDVVDHVRPASRDGAVGLVNRPVSATAEATASVQLRLDAVDRALAGLVLAVSSYRGEQLSALGSIVTEVVDETGAVLVRAETPATSTSAVVLATVVRADDGAWLLTAVGSPASGRTAPSLVGAGYWALAGAVVE